MRRPSVRLSRYCSWLPLQPKCVAHTWPRRLEKPAVPAATSSEESWPVRPCRPVRTQVPCCTVCRCGWFSRHQRPVRSSSSVAFRGTGSTVASSSSWYAAAPLLVSVCASSRRPPGWRVSSELTSSPASESRWMISTPRPPSCTWAETTRRAGEKSWPGPPSAFRCPRRPGRPAQPEEACGSSPAVTGMSRAEWGTGPRRIARLGRCSPRSAPQWTISASPESKASRRLVPAERRCTGCMGFAFSCAEVRCWCAGPRTGTPRTGRRRCRRLWLQGPT
jgi:hypothetical protein